jgi:hypothetical protein
MKRIVCKLVWEFLLSIHVAVGSYLFQTTMVATMTIVKSDNKKFGKTYYYSNFPSVNGLIGTCSLLSLSLSNISSEDDCSSFISIPISLFIMSLPSLAPIRIICAF